MPITMMIQRTLRLALVSGTLVPLLAGCSSAHTGSTPASKPAMVASSGSPASQTDTRPIIACFGDSLTAGYGVDFDSSYPANLQRDLDAAGYHYHVVNLGISGETTKDGLNRVDQVIAMKPAIVVVEFGGNDGLRGVPVPLAKANLDAIVNKLIRSGTRVVLAGITLPPQYSAPYIKDFNATYPALAKQYKVPLLPFVLQGVYGVPGNIQPDGIHPTAQGCIGVARNIFNLIKPLLQHS